MLAVKRMMMSAGVKFTQLRTSLKEITLVFTPETEKTWQAETPAMFFIMNDHFSQENKKGTANAALRHRQFHLYI